MANATNQSHPRPRIPVDVPPANAPAGTPAGDEQTVTTAEYALLLSFLAAAVVLCLAVPAWRRTPLGDLNMFYLIPGLPLCLVVFLLAGVSGDAPAGSPHRTRHQAAAIAMAGCAPFFSWWSRAPENPYLTVMLGVGTVVLVWFMIEILILLRRVSRANGLPGLATAALRAEPVAAVLFGGPAIAVWVAGAAARLWRPSLPPDEVRRLWETGPGLLPMAGLVSGAAIACIAWLLGRALLRRRRFSGFLSGLFVLEERAGCVPDNEESSLS